MKEYIVQAIEQETIDSFDAHNAPELIRCKDCKHGEPWGVLIGCGTAKGFGITHGQDWFCADGIAKDIISDKKAGEPDV